MPDHEKDKKDLRAAMRARRRQVNNAAREESARRVLQLARRNGLLASGRRVALYLARDGEIDTAPIIQYAWRNGARVMLPVVPNPSQRRLHFAPFHPASVLVPDRYGIPVPQCDPKDLVTARCLDVVLLPLVSFDRRGTRLGMGAGHYDATLYFLQSRRRWHRPRLIGLGYAFQESTEIPRDTWDVAMHGVITDDEFIQVHPN